MKIKKLVEVRGTLEYPLEIGYSAFIKPAGQATIRTSAVQKFTALPAGRIYIETKNTHYLILPIKSKVISGVPS